MECLVANLAGEVRRAKLHGREHLVAPLSLIVPGVLDGSQGPLLYPELEIARNVKDWDGVPITVGHPQSADGEHISARSPDVLDRQGVGVVRHACFNGKLRAEGWFDVARTRAVDLRVLEALEKNSPMEISTGLFTDNEPAANDAQYHGRPYAFVARNYRPDHLAVLPDQVGACSVGDGCGMNVNYSPSQPRDAAGRWGSGGGGGGGGGGRGVGRAVSGQVIEGQGPGNAAQQKYPHISHLLNGAAVVGTGKTKADVKPRVMDMRKRGHHASVIKDPKGKGDQKYLIVVPESEAPFKMNQAANQLSHLDLRQRLVEVLIERYGQQARVEEVYDDAVVYAMISGVERPDQLKLYRLGYTIGAKDKLALADGPGEEVQRVTGYEPVENQLVTNPKGQWTPPEAGKGAPEEINRILRAVYTQFRDKNPQETASVKARGAKIAWGAVRSAGWRKTKEGKWMKQTQNTSQNDQRSRLQALLYKRLNLDPRDSNLWIEDISDGHVVYTIGGRMYQLGFKGEDSDLSLSGDEPEAVARLTEYKPVENKEEEEEFWTAMNELADSLGEEDEEDPITENRTQGIRRALRALGRAKRANKARWASGAKSGFKIGGKSVARATFSRKIGGVPESYKEHADKTNLSRVVANDRDGRIGPVNNRNEGGSVMTEEERKKMIDFVVANCSYCEKDDRESIGALSDERLTAWRDNLIANQQAQAVVDAVREARPDTAVSQMPELVANHLKPTEPKPLTDDEWMAVAPPRVKTAVQTAMEIVDSERTQLVSRLTANVEDEKVRERLAERLKGRPIDELRELAVLAPPAKPDAAGPLANYFGAAQPAPPAQPETLDEVLVIPAIDFAAEARSRAGRIG